MSGATEGMSDDETIAAGLSAADRLRAQIAALERARDEQPEKLAAARREAAAAREQALAQEPWSELMTAVPSVDADGNLHGMLAIPTIDGKELMGVRLAFDLLGCCANEEEVDEVLSDYFSWVREPDHMFLVVSAALTTIVSHVVPQMLDDLEQQGSNWTARLLLAEAARNAWEGRIGQYRDDPGRDTCQP